MPCKTLIGNRGRERGGGGRITTCPRRRAQPCRQSLITRATAVHVGSASASLRSDPSSFHPSIPPTESSHFLRVSLPYWTVLDGLKLRSNMARHEAAGVQHVEERVERRATWKLSSSVSVFPETSILKFTGCTCGAGGHVPVISDWAAPSPPTADGTGPRPQIL